MSENEESEIILGPTFSEYLNLNKYLPHQLLFINESITSEEKEKFNYLWAVLYLLTNSVFLMEHFLSLNHESYNNKEKSFNYMIGKLYDCIKTNKEIQEEENKKQKLDLSITSIKKFRESFQVENVEPRNLIIEILLRTLKFSEPEKRDSFIRCGNSFGHSEEQNPSSGSLKDEVDIFLNKKISSSYSSLESSIESSYIWFSNYEETENKGKDIVIKTRHIDGNVKYRYSNFILFNLEENPNKQYKLDDCFKNYLKEVRFPELKEKVYFKLPETIIIVLYFGKDEENPQNCLYEFDEILDFSKEEYAECLDETLQNKKYILSSLLVCKYPKQHNEIFYTFCRNNDRKFFMYFNKDTKVSEEDNVNNKIKKSEKVKIEGNTSYPYVLIYDEIKIEK